MSKELAYCFLCSIFCNFSQTVDTKKINLTCIVQGKETEMKCACQYSTWKRGMLDYNTWRRL